MSAPTEVYRTTDPELLAAWDKAAEEKRRWYDAVAEFCEEHSGDRRWWHSNFLGREHFDGPLVPADDVVPVGWRRDRKRPGMMRPNRRTPEGKEIAKTLAELSWAPSFDTALQGMPSTVDGEHDPQRGSHRVHSCGASRSSAYLEVQWGVKVPADQIDGRWTKVPLSQWHLEKEQDEEANLRNAGTS